MLSPPFLSRYKICSARLLCHTASNNPTHSLFREASESIDGVSGRCFFAWKGCETYSTYGQIMKTCVWLQFWGVSIHGRWKPQKTTTVDGDFGGRLQKASSLSGNSTCYGSLWPLCGDVAGETGTKRARKMTRTLLTAILLTLSSRQLGVTQNYDWNH